MASLLNHVWSGLDFWDKEENKKQRQQYAAQKAAPRPQVQQPQIQRPQQPGPSFIDRVGSTITKPLQQPISNLANSLFSQQELQRMQNNPSEIVKTAASKAINPTNIVRANPLTAGSLITNTVGKKLGITPVDSTKMVDAGFKKLGESSIGKNRVVKFTANSIAKPVADSFARYSDVSSGQQRYADGMKGAGQLGTDAFNIGSTLYTPVKAGVLAKGGAEAWRAAPGALARGFGAASGINVVNQLGEGKKLNQISLPEAGLSGLLGAGANILPGVAGVAGRTLKSGATKFLRNMNVKPLNQAGFIELGRTPKKIHPEDQNVMSDFIDYQRGIYKPRPNEAHRLEIDASRIAERYGLPMPSTTQELAGVFEQRLQQDKFMAEPVQAQPDPQSMRARIQVAKERVITPLNEGGYVQTPVGPSKTYVIPKTNSTDVTKLSGQDLQYFSKQGYTSITDRYGNTREIKQTAKQPSVTDPFKARQLEVVNKSNPMLNEYNTGIRSVDDIKTFREAFDDPESFTYPDFNRNAGAKALKDGKVTIYSSKPLDSNNAQFVTPSEIQASEYAGGGKVYSKEVGLDEVAWINGDEGQLVGRVAGAKKSLKDKLGIKPLNEVGAIGRDVRPDQDPLESLKQEARKYKSAEEFRKNLIYNDDVILHQTGKNTADKIKTEGFKAGKETGLGEKRGEVYGMTAYDWQKHGKITKDNYARDGSGLAEVAIDTKGLKIVDRTKQKFTDEQYVRGDHKRIPEGYDGVKVGYGNGVSEVLLKPEVANARRFDITDLYNQAQKETTVPKADDIDIFDDPKTYYDANETKKQFAARRKEGQLGKDSYLYGTKKEIEKTKSQFEQNLEDAGIKPKGFILKETKGRAGRKDTVRIAPDGKGGLKATKQTEDVINPDAPDFLQVNKNDVPVTPSTSKYSAPKLPIDNPQSRLRPQSDMTAVPLENTGVTRFNEAAPRQIKGRVKKDAVVKSVLGEISKSKGKGNVEASIIAADLTTKAKRLGVKLDRKFIDKYQAGALDTPAEKQMGAAIKQVTDELFRKQQALDPTIQYRKNYIPQSYAQDAATVEEATKRLAKTTGAANRRTFNTYKEAESFGLTPRDKNLEQMLGHAASKVEQVAQNRKVVQKGMEGGIFTTNQSGGTPLMGVFAPDGSQLYAKKQVADVINGVLQKDSTGLAKAIAKTAHAFGVAQDVMLQGGVPGTNANFFVAGQMVKDTTRNIGKAPLHPIQATKQEGHLLGDFFRGNKGTQKRFAEGTFKAGGKQIKNSDFVRQMADRGLYIQPQTKLTGEGKNIVARGWNKLGNNPTFGRYMPNRMLSTAQEVYAQSVKKLGHDKALDLAAETTKTFTGHVDTILKGRSGLTEDVAGIFLFAPKYRESILGALGNVVKSTYPTNWNNPKFKPSRQLLAGMAVTLGAYELMNRELTGHSMMQNRPGQELSVEIPYGEKDDKGNQKVLNIPFMPGFMTIPRAAFSAANALRKGDAKGVIAEAGKALSAPMQDATAIIGNRDYFGNPIYIDKATAEKEGVSPDSAFTASKKIGGYLFGQLSPSWVRGGQQLAAGKPKEQAIATALEAPLKFGKRLNPDTVAYFDRRDKFTATLNKNEKAMFDKINPSKKNIRGEDIKDEGTLVKASNYADLIAHPEFADKYQAYQKSAPSHDPLWDLNKNQLRSYMQAQVISKNNPGGDGNTVRQLYDRLPKDFFATREKYFADLKKKGVKFDSKNKPNPGMPDKLVAFSEAYHKLPYGTGARKAALNSQTGKEYIAWLEQNKIRNNQERADLGLPPLEDKGSSYGGYSKGGGGGGRKGSGGGGRKGSGTAKLASVLKASNAAIKPPAKPKSPGIKVKTSNVPTTFKKAPLKKYAVAKVTVGKSRR